MTWRGWMMAAGIAVGAQADEAVAPIAAQWRFVADGVMGGVSVGRMDLGPVAGRPAARLSGQVSLENNGGFLQITTDFAPDAAPVDASAWTGVEIDIWGNGETYEARLKTSDVRRPWQSYRLAFRAPATWTTLRIPFAALEPYRLDAPFDATELRRLGLVAVGRAFEADLAVAGLRFYR